MRTPSTTARPHPPRRARRRTAGSAALILAFGALPAVAHDGDAHPPSATPATQTSCPAGAAERRADDGGAMARLRDRMAADLAAGGGAAPRALDGSGYNYGGDAGSVSLPGALTFEATLP